MRFKLKKFRRLLFGMGIATMAYSFHIQDFWNAITMIVAGSLLMTVGADGWD